MYKPFNNFETMEIKINYNNEDIKVRVFEEECCEDNKELEGNYNLIAIEFDSESPFDTKERQEKFGEEKYFGYVVDITENEIRDIDLIASGMGWGDTWEYDKVITGSEEYKFIEMVLKQAGLK